MLSGSSRVAAAFLLYFDRKNVSSGGIDIGLETRKMPKNAREALRNCRGVHRGPRRELLLATLSMCVLRSFFLSFSSPRLSNVLAVNDDGGSVVLTVFNLHDGSHDRHHHRHGDTCNKIKINNLYLGDPLIFKVARHTQQSPVIGQGLGVVPC
jgi:hypothetical protein